MLRPIVHCLKFPSCSCHSYTSDSSICSTVHALVTLITYVPLALLNSLSFSISFSLSLSSFHALHQRRSTTAGNARTRRQQRAAERAPIWTREHMLKTLSPYARRSRLRQHQKQASWHHQVKIQTLSPSLILLFFSSYVTRAWNLANSIVSLSLCIYIYSGRERGKFMSKCVYIRKF